jgi:hypothetical protein
LTLGELLADHLRHLGRVLKDRREDVPQEMDTTLLVGGAGHDLADHLDQAAVGVGDDQAHSGQVVAT